jgi:hypothetical protein
MVPSATFERPLVPEALSPLMASQRLWFSIPTVAARSNCCRNFFGCSQYLQLRIIIFALFISIIAIYSFNKIS